MPGGRPPKPFEQHRIRGTYRKDRHKKPPRISSGDPKCPDWLDEEAKAEWGRILPELRESGILKVIDHGVLAIWCQAWSDFRDAVETIRKDGSTTATSTGYLAPHPAVAMKKQAIAAMKACMSELGMSPAGRMKVAGSAGPNSGESDAEREFFADAPLRMAQ